jgi:hypothetical protein
MARYGATEPAMRLRLGKREGRDMKVETDRPVKGANVLQDGAFISLLSLMSAPWKRDTEHERHRT